MFIDSLQIGITNRCNCSCIHCGQNAHEGYGHPGGMGPPPFQGGIKGDMDLSLYKRILTGICRDEIRFNVYNFFWFGEQLLHPGFRDFLDLTFDIYLGFPFFDNFWIYTNGILLKEKTLDRLIHTAREFPNAFTRIYISLDAGNSRDYRKIKHSDAYEETVSNIIDFIKHRTRFGLSSPQIVLGFIVLPENQESAGECREFWEKTFADHDLPLTVCMDSPHPREDCLYFRVAYLPEQKKFENLYQETCVELGLLEPEDVRHDSIIRKTSMEMIDADTLKPDISVRRACPAPFRCVTVNWDGRLASCCSDYEFENTLPALQEKSLLQAWHSEEYRLLRRAHLSGNLTEFPRCQHCGGLDALGVSEKDIQLLGEDYSGLWVEYMDRINER